MQNSSTPFFDYETLSKGSQRIIQSIKNSYEIHSNRVVFPPLVEPGFFRRQISQTAPQKGKSIENIVENIQNKMLPHLLFMPSPKYFGHFALSISVTSILAEMFATAFHSPGNLYMFSPAFTQLENIVVDWCALMTGLPQKFLFKSKGGGIIDPSATQAILTVIHAAKRRKMEELDISLSDPKICKLVGYYSDFCNRAAQKALNLKDVPYRKQIPSYYNQVTKNFEINPQQLEAIIQKDIEEGLIPFWFGATFGSTFTSAVDISTQVATIIKKYGLWLNIDAVYLGSALILEENRPTQNFFEFADSIQINFSKNLLAGNGGSLLFVADRRQFYKSISRGLDVCYFKNQYSDLNNQNQSVDKKLIFHLIQEFSQKQESIDYMDWTVGLDRRLNVLKFYFMFEHYGMQKLKQLIRLIHEKANLLKQWIQNSPILQLFTHKYGLVTLRMRDPITNNASNQLTKKLIIKTMNTENGYCTPGQLNGYNFVRINAGNFFTKEEHLRAKFEQVQRFALEIRQQKLKTLQNNDLNGNSQQK